MDRANCPMRHENGNCLPCGGFCAAVNDPICEALHNAFYHGAEEERDRLVLSMIDANAKYQKRQLEILRNIHEKVTGDTVAVVRCKDCKHCDPESHCCDHPMSTLIPIPRKAEDFCSYGERKDGDSDDR